MNTIDNGRPVREPRRTIRSSHTRTRGSHEVQIPGSEVARHRRRPPRRRLVALAALAATGSLWFGDSSRAQPARAADPEFQVNEYTTSSQFGGRVGMSRNGDFVIVWTSFGQDGADRGVVARRFDRLGVPQATEFLVNTYTTGDQKEAELAVHEDGSFVVTWVSEGQDGSGLGVFAQRFDTTGSPTGQEFQVNTLTTDDQGPADVAPLGDGRFVIVWEEGISIQGQRFDSSGERVANQFEVNPAGGGAGAVAGNSAGEFVVAWKAYDPDSYYVISARTYDAMGQPIGQPFEVGGGFYGNPEVTMSDNGNFVVSFNPDSFGSFGGVAAPRFDLQGTPLPGFSGAVHPSPPFIVRGPTAAADPEGNVILAWSAIDDSPDLNAAVYARTYDPDGNTLDDDLFPVSVITSSPPGYPSVAMLSASEFVVVWSRSDPGNTDLFARRYGPFFADGFESADTTAWSTTVP